ncbi:MAG: hypothetical protein WBD87_09330 [Candidatus Acidiferrales bacterium]
MASKASEDFFIGVAAGALAAFGIYFWLGRGNAPQVSTPLPYMLPGLPSNGLAGTDWEMFPPPARRLWRWR